MNYRIAGREVTITIAEMISGTMFLLLGIFIIYLAQAGKLAMENSAMQTSINIFMSNLTASINKFIAGMPTIAWIAIAALPIAVFLLRKLKRKTSK